MGGRVDLDSKTPNLDRMIEEEQTKAREATARVAELIEIRTDLLRGVDNHVTPNPALSSGGFDKLPWKTNKFGERIFANLPEAKELVAKIGIAKSWTDTDGWEYKLSGDSKNFINRSKSR